MGKAKAGLVCGIVSLACGVLSMFIPGWFGLLVSIAALPLGIVGLVLSAKAGKAQKSGVATAGLVIGIIATVLAGIGFACTLCGVCALLALAGAVA